MSEYKIVKVDDRNWKITRIRKNAEVRNPKTGMVETKDVSTDVGYFPRLSQAVMAVYDFVLKDQVPNGEELVSSIESMVAITADAEIAMLKYALEIESGDNNK